MTIWTAIGITALFSIAFGAYMTWLCSDPKVRPIPDLDEWGEGPSKVHQINDLLAVRAFHQEKMAAHMQDLLELRDTFVDLHGEDPSTSEGCTLVHFWLNADETYPETLDRINQLRAAK